MAAVMSSTTLPGKDILTDTLVSTSIWKLLCIILILINIKNLPGIWHIRLFNGLRFVLRSERSRVPIRPSQLFQPIITESHGTLMELDYNMHKSNSTYFQDVDVARTHLLCTLFSKGIEQARSSKGEDIIGGAGKPFGVALGAVSCSFRKEINPFEKYDMFTRILSWDRKWIYIVTHFVRKNQVEPRRFSLYPNQKNKNAGMNLVDNKEDAVIASALSKVVFKKGRLTIPPEIMLQASGLLPPRPSDVAPLQTQILAAPKQRSLIQEAVNAPFKFIEKADLLIEAVKERVATERQRIGRGSRSSSPDGTVDKEEEWTWARMEEERSKGLEMSSKLNGLDGLVSEFTADGDALGRHSDLWWCMFLTY